jgi:hypothetical protein
MTRLDALRAEADAETEAVARAARTVWAVLSEGRLIAIYEDEGDAKGVAPYYWMSEVVPRIVIPAA